MKIVNTKELTREEWLELRKKSIGGSDAATVAGLNPYSSLIELYADKKGLIPEKKDNEAMKLGREMEDIVAKRYSEVSGNEVRNDYAMYKDDELDFITANIDRKILKSNGILECKIMNPRTADRLELSEDNPPAHYYCQCQHYMMVKNAEFADLAILVLQRGLTICHIKRDDKFISELREAEIKFWKEFIEKDVMPAPDGSESAEAIVKSLYADKDVCEDEIITLGDDVNILCDKLNFVKSEIKAMKDLESELKQKIQVALDGHSLAETPKYKINWKSSVRESLDTKKIKEDMPSVAENYKKITEVKTLYIKEKK